MDLLDTCVSLALQVSSLGSIAGGIWLAKHPRVRNHAQRRYFIALLAISIAVLMGLHVFVWASFVNARHPTLINGRPVPGSP